MRRNNPGSASLGLSALAILFPISCVAGSERNIPDLDWKALHQDPPHFIEVDHAVQQGFAACRTTLADTLLHATGGRERQSLVNVATQSADSRPVSVLSVVASSSTMDTKGHAQTMVGVDASGACFAQWSETRFWEMKCARLRDSAERYEGYRIVETMLENSVRLDSDGGSIDVIMTDLGENCLVTEREMYYHDDANPDFSVPVDEP